MATDWQDPRMTLIERLCNVNMAPVEPVADPPVPQNPFVSVGAIWDESGHQSWVKDTLPTFTANNTDPISDTYSDDNGDVISYGCDLPSQKRPNFVAKLQNEIADADGDNGLDLLPTAPDWGLYGALLAVMGKTSPTLTSPAASDTETY